MSAGKDYDPQRAREEALCAVHEVEALARKYSIPILCVIGLPKTEQTVVFGAGLMNEVNRQFMAMQVAQVFMAAEQAQGDQPPAEGAPPV